MLKIYLKKNFNQITYKKCFEIIDINRFSVGMQYIRNSLDKLYNVRIIIYHNYNSIMLVIHEFDYNPFDLSLYKSNEDGA